MGVLSSILNNAAPLAKKVKLDQPETKEQLKEVVGAHPVQDTPWPTVNSTSRPTVEDLTKQNMPTVKAAMYLCTTISSDSGLNMWTVQDSPLHNVLAFRCG